MPRYVLVMNFCRDTVTLLKNMHNFSFGHLRKLNSAAVEIVDLLTSFFSLFLLLTVLYSFHGKTCTSALTP